MNEKWTMSYIIINYTENTQNVHKDMIQYCSILNFTSKWFSIVQYYLHNIYNTYYNSSPPSQHAYTSSNAVFEVKLKVTNLQ